MVGVALVGARGHRRQRDRGVTLVEFAIVAPIAFFVLLALMVVGIYISNNMALSNAVREGARAAATCGGAGFAYGDAVAKGVPPTIIPPNHTLPNGALCTSSAPGSTNNISAYIESRVQTIPDLTPTIVVCAEGSCTGGDQTLTDCTKGTQIQVTASYKQPLYVPLVGNFIGDASDPGHRTINARATATCEQ